MAIRTFIFVTFLAMLLVIPDSANVSFSMGSKHIREKGLYGYGGREFSKFLKKAGYPDYVFRAPGEVSRNSEGSELRFYDWSRNKVIFVSCHGIMKEIRLPGRKKTWNKRPVWFDKEHQVVAWIEDGNVRYGTGIREDSDIMRIVTEPCGGYFVRTAIPKGAEICSIEKPELPLARADVLGTGVLKIFSKDDEVYLFDYDSKDGPLKGYIFEKEGQKLIRKQEFVIPRPKASPAPFYVEDISPWDDNILLIDGRDWPSKSEWYVFNLATRKMKKIGNADNYGFFLLCDIIK